MENIIYAYEGQLMTLINLPDSSTLITGVAFEWKNEDVFHVYTSMPNVAPSGYPSSAFFKIITDHVAFENSKKQFDYLADELYNPDNNYFNSVLGIFLFLDDKKLNHKVFRKYAGVTEDCALKFIPEKSELYSRSKGLLEVDILESKNVLIIGLGSFGSQIAVELSKAGVGRLTLIDFDRIELSNISRHICGVNDLGRLKVHAVKDAILIKNPYANVETFPLDINANLTLLSDLISKSDLIICATDNNRSRFNINSKAKELDKTVLFGRAITRAEGGDIFRLKGNRSSCYCCLVSLHSVQEEISSLKHANSLLPEYTSAEDKKAAVQVGLSSDILPMCNLMVKLALMELSKGLLSGISSLETELTYDYYFWANRRENNYLNYQPFNNSKMQPTILKWYGVHIPEDAECILCAQYKNLNNE